MRSSYSSLLPTRRRGGMADALDSKSSDRKIVWVQPPPPALPFFSSELAFFRGKIAAKEMPIGVQERMRWSGSALARQIQSNGDQGFPH